MASIPNIEMIGRKYREVFEATPRPAYVDWLEATAGSGAGAALGYRRASEASLFLEAYLDEPIETIISHALGRPVARGAIVEIGNFASDNALAMVKLWGSAANDLAGASEVAVATLTAPLRSMFSRIGLPITVLAPALPGRLGAAAKQWGRYYQADPKICMGIIADGQSAIADFLGRRARRVAA